MEQFWFIVFIALVVLFALEMYHSMKRSEETNRMIHKYYEDKDNPAMAPEILAYCQKDFKLKRIVAKYNITADDIWRMNRRLMIWGDFKKGRRFVPISSFYYAYSLEYLFTHQEAEDVELAKKMMNFFHI